MCPLTAINSPWSYAFLTGKLGSVISSGEEIPADDLDELASAFDVFEGAASEEPEFYRLAVADKIGYFKEARETGVWANIYSALMTFDIMLGYTPTSKWAELSQTWAPLLAQTSEFVVKRAGALFERLDPSLQYQRLLQRAPVTMSDEESPDPSETEIQRAVRYLADQIPLDQLPEIVTALASGLAHFEIGIYVRNLLRQGGFNWGDIYLDDNWRELLTKALKIRMPMVAGNAVDRSDTAIELHADSRWASIDKLISENRGGPVVEASLRMVNAYIEDVTGNPAEAIRNLKRASDVLYSQVKIVYRELSAVTPGWTNNDELDKARKENSFWFSASVWCLEHAVQIALQYDLPAWPFQLMYAALNRQACHEGLDGLNAHPRKSDLATFSRLWMDIIEQAPPKTRRRLESEHGRPHPDWLSAPIEIDLDAWSQLSQHGISEIEHGEVESGINKLLAVADYYQRAEMKREAAQTFLKLASLLVTHRPNGNPAETSIYFAKAYRLFRDVGSIKDAIAALSEMFSFLEKAAH